MKKALRERMARPADDHNTTVDTRGSSSAYSKIATSAALASTASSVTTVSSHNCVSAYAKNTVPGTGSYSVAAASANLNLPTLSARHQSWPHHSVGSQHNVVGDKSAVQLSSTSSSLRRNDSSNLMQQPVATEHFNLRHSASHTQFTHANRH